MKLEQSFDVDAPLDRVWEALVDVERVAPCLPGAAVTGRNDDGTYNGTFTIKIGPTTASYAGKLEMQSVDESAHRATMHAQGSDKRGQGGATATIVSSLSEAEGRTRVQVVTDYHITGRLARFGRGGMIEDISERLLREFAGRLQSSLVGRGADEAPTAVHEIPAAAAAGNGGGGPAEAPPPATESAAPAGESVAPPTLASRATPASAGAEPAPEPERAAPPEAERARPPEPERAVRPEPAPPPPPDPAAAEEPPPPPPPAPPTPADAPAPTAGEAPPPVEAAAPPAAETPPAETPSPPAPQPAQAAPPPPPPPATPPPPRPPVEPAPPIEGTSLVASVLVDRVKRNPKPVLAVAGGLVLLRLLRRR